MSEKEQLLSNSISEQSIQIDPKNKNYTIPRTFGVYEISNSKNCKKFRYGNHPVREIELMHEFGKVIKCVLFLDRDDAKSLSDYLNS